MGPNAWILIGSVYTKNLSVDKTSTYFLMSQSEIDNTWEDTTKWKTKGSEIKIHVTQYK